MNKFVLPSSYSHGKRANDIETRARGTRNEIIKYRTMAKNAPDPVTTARIKELVDELEQRVREIDE